MNDITPITPREWQLFGRIHALTCELLAAQKNRDEWKREAKARREAPHG